MPKLSEPAPQRKPYSPAPMGPLVLHLILSAGLFFGAVLARMMLPGKAHPYDLGYVTAEPRALIGNAADDPEAVDGCVPVLVSDDTREGDTAATFGDKFLDTRAKVSVSDRTFAVEASAEASDLTATFNPPIVIKPGSGTVNVPLPPSTTAVVRPVGRIVCEVRPDGVCAPAVETPSNSLWGLSNAPANVAVRAEHQDVAPGEVRVDFFVRSALGSAGNIQGDGLFVTPPAGSIDFGGLKNTVSPFIGAARWRCDWTI